MIDSAIRQARLVVANESDAILAGNVFGGDDCKFAPVELRIKTDLLDFAARNLAADGRPVKHPGQSHIIDVSRCARYFVAAFLAGHRFADDLLCGHLYP